MILVQIVFFTTVPVTHLTLTSVIITHYWKDCCLNLFVPGPVPPDHIQIQPGTNSLHLSWDNPQLSDAPDISYSITYQSEGGQPQPLSSMENSLELRNLSSGTGYNITLVTIGPQNLTSAAITKFAVTSRFHKDTHMAEWFKICSTLFSTCPAHCF